MQVSHYELLYNTGSTTQSVAFDLAGAQAGFYAKSIELINLLVFCAE